MNSVICPYHNCSKIILNATKCPITVSNANNGLDMVKFNKDSELYFENFPLFPSKNELESRRFFNRSTIVSHSKSSLQSSETKIALKYLVHHLN